MESLRIIFKKDLVTGEELLFCEDFMFCEELNVLLVDEMRKSLRCGLEVRKTALLGLCKPFVCVAVSVEDDPLMLLKGIF